MGEILLGARRGGRSKRVAKKLTIGGALGLGILVVAYVAFRHATSFPPPDGTPPAGPLVADGGKLVLRGTAGSATLERSGELWVLRLAGAPYAIGAAHARLLGQDVRAGDALDPLLFGDRRVGGWLARLRRDAALRWRFRLLYDGIPAEIRRELAGLASALPIVDPDAAVGYQQLVWRQATLDLGATPGGLLPLGGATSGLAFAVSGPPPLGHVVVGRMFSVPGADPLGAPVVSFVRREGALAFARVGWGGQVGVVTGVNAASLVVALNPAVAQDVRPGVAATPLPLIARQVLEQARSLEEAIALIQGARPLGAGVFLLVDGKTGTWAVVERTPAKTVVQRPKTPPVTGDTLDAPEFAKDAENDRFRRVRGTARRDRLAEIVARSVAAEPETVVAVLRDRLGAGDTRLPIGNGNAIDDLASAHAAVIDATSLTLWVNEGPGAAGAFRAFDLRHELLQEAPRAGATAALPADPTLDAAIARNLVQARQTVRTARALAARGRRAAAAELAARALAQAPELPEAHRLAGDLARARRDDARAREHYQRFLDLAPVNRAAVEEVRAFLGLP